MDNPVVDLGRLHPWDVSTLPVFGGRAARRAPRLEVRDRPHTAHLPRGWAEAGIRLDPLLAAESYGECTVQESPLHLLDRGDEAVLHANRVVNDVQESGYA